MLNNQDQKQSMTSDLRQDLRQHLNIVFIGHVDAGKSTLGGQILLSTNQIDQRTIEKYKREAIEKNRESWFLAYILDSSEEERERGKTVQVGRAFFETTKKRYTILDAPGHAKYVPNMIGGTTQADVAVLVISARKGEFEDGFKQGGQTKEHATLAKTLGVKRLVVVINKMDEKTVRWSKDRYDEIIKDLIPFLSQIGFSKKFVSYVPCSAYKGQNVIMRISNEDKKPCDWYDGPSLIETLDQLVLKNKKADKELRIPIIDYYKNNGLVCLGKIESGTIKVGQDVILMPRNIKGSISEIYLHKLQVDIAKAGENVQIHFKNIENMDAIGNIIGNVICTEDTLLIPIKEFIGQIAVLNTKPIFTVGYSTIMHIHTITTQVTVTKILNEIDKKTGKEINDKVKFAVGGRLYTTIFKTKKPICVEKYENLQALGRFTLREEQTVAIGKITKIKPLKKSKK